MDTRNTKLVDALNRVEDFLARNPEVMSTVITSAAHQNFSASRARLEEHMKAQDEHIRGARYSVATQHALRRRLIRKHMRPISVVARVELPAGPELSALTVRTRTKQLGALVAAGYGMARAAEAHEAVFLAAGLPGDFIAKLVAATDALKESMSVKGQARALRTRATAGLTKEGRVARHALRVLDTLVRAAIEEGDVLLDEWGSISRVAADATAPRALGDGAAPAGGADLSDGSPASAEAPASPAGINGETREAPAAA